MGGLGRFPVGRCSVMALVHHHYSCIRTAPAATGSSRSRAALTQHVSARVGDVWNGLCHEVLKPVCVFRLESPLCPFFNLNKVKDDYFVCSDYSKGASPFTFYLLFSKRLVMFSPCQSYWNAMNRTQEMLKCEIYIYIFLLSLVDHVCLVCLNHHVLRFLLSKCF